MSLSATQPIEFYTFVGSFRTYRYTSADTSLTLDAQLYEALPIGRGAVRAGDQTQDQLDVEITLPYDAEVVRDYAYLSAPATLQVIITAIDRSADLGNGAFASSGGVVLWSGQASGFSVTKRVARCRVPSNFVRSLNNEVPSVYYQNPCNHVLYDTRCKVLRASFETTTTVTGITGGTLIGVTDDGAADDFLNAGEIVNNRTGERRLVLRNVANAITIPLEFVDILVGDEVALAAGCDHSFNTCRTKFNNTINYGGFPFIPTDNPFEGAL